MLALTIYLYGKGEIGFDGILTCTIAMMGSFGPVVALSSLSNNLNQTLASGERVLSLLEEKPLVEEIADGTGFHVAEMFNSVEKQKESGVGFTGAEASHVTFAYEEETILDDYSLKLAPGKITGIHGSSGSGKSTLLKIVTGVLNPTSGNVELKGRVSAILELGAGFNMEYTGIENIFLNGTMLGYTEEEMKAKLDPR